ncbi:MAG: DUF2953 domain-containing protein [Clostridia bacterium]|nr:DUF2953 domain-containing protein [Clostridia bacterium]
MIILYILAGIAAFILLLCLIPLRVRIKVHDSFSLTAGIGAITLFRIPEKKKKTHVDLRDFTYNKHRKRLEKEAAASEKRNQKLAQKKEAKRLKKEQAAKKKEEAKQHAAEHGTDTPLSEKISGILELVELVLDELPNLFGRFHCRINRLHVIVGGKDAASAAVNFGIISQAAAYLLEILDNKTRLHKPKNNSIVVKVDYIREKSDFDLDITLQVRVGGILRTVFSLLVGFIRTKMKK